MLKIREATDRDVTQIKELFFQCYGSEYAYPSFYDEEWLKRSIYDSRNYFLVVEMDEDIVATASIITEGGNTNNLVAEIGRLVSSPDERVRGKGIAQQLINELIEHTKHKFQFVYGEARTAHGASQRILDNLDWKVVGFEPLKHLVKDRRESIVLYAKINKSAFELRRNNPRVIPEIAQLAQLALKNTNCQVDVIVHNENNGYPTKPCCEMESLKKQNLSSLLRIEGGRIANREIFSTKDSLSHAFFHFNDSSTHYLVAKNGKILLGAVGFIYSEIEKKIKIIELIEFDDSVKGYLLASVEKTAREEYKVDFIEVDISAYSPKMQRTFERLGFIPASYLPAMVFDKVERLDIVRMIKINCQYDLGKIKIREKGIDIFNVVEKGLDNRLLGLEITSGTRKAAIFKDLYDGEMYHLAKIAFLREFKKGTLLVKEGDIADSIYILVDGSAEVRTGDKQLAELRAGSIFGEMALVEKSKRSADIILLEDCKIIEISISQLERLMEKYPRLGYVIAINLAKNLSLKLKKMNIK